MTDELKPCPFCGGKANLVSDYSSEQDETRWNVWHECEGCEGESAGYGSSYHPWFDTPWYKTKAEALHAWNRRVVPPTATETDELPPKWADAPTLELGA